jgi:NAD(P) transhydrogenase
VGDVIGFPSLASTSMEQGRIAACHAFNEAAHAPPEFFPYGIYSVPEISTVGMTEEQVREKHIPYETGIARFRETSRGHIMGLHSGFMKMIFALESRRLLGVHIVGEGATELIHIGQAVLNLGGGLDYFVENTFNYPTLAEAYKIAALDAFNRMPAREKPVVHELQELAHLAAARIGKAGAG